MVYLDASQQSVKFSLLLAYDKETITGQQIFLNGRQLTSDPAYHSWWPKISPSHKKILFVRSPIAQESYDESYDNTSLWLLDLADLSVTQLVTAATFTSMGVPNWSPDGKQIVFFGDGQIRLFTLSTQTITAVPIIGAGSVTDTSFHPSGDLIAFCADGDVFTVPVTGGLVTRITDDGSNYDPNWNTDGSVLGYLKQTGPVDGSHVVGQWGIYQVNHKGNVPTALIDDGNANSKPCYGPDGFVYFHRLTYPITTDWQLCRISDCGGAVEVLSNENLSRYGFPHVVQGNALDASTAEWL